MDDNDVRLSRGAAALGLFAALAFQSTVGPLLAFRHAVPSFVLLLVLWIAARTGPAEALEVGALAGAGEDTLAGTGAAWTIATALVSILAATTAPSSVANERRAFATVVVAATALRCVLFEFVLQIEHRPLPSLHPLLWQMGENALLALLATARSARRRESHGYTR